MVQQIDTIVWLTLIPRTWFPNHSNTPAVSYKPVLEPTKTDQYEQSYDGIKWTTQIVTNKNPRKLISFFAPMPYWQPFIYWGIDLPVTNMVIMFRTNHLCNWVLCVRHEINVVNPYKWNLPGATKTFTKLMYRTDYEQVLIKTRSHWITFVGKLCWFITLFILVQF